MTWTPALDPPSVRPDQPVDAGCPLRQRAVRSLTRRRMLTGALAMSAALLPPVGARPARAALPDGDIVGELTYYLTDGSSTLLHVARDYDLGILEISALNPGIDVWVPGERQLVVLPTAHLLPEVEHQGIVVNLAELRIYDMTAADGNVITHAIGVGRDGFDTPRGETTVVRKKVDPTWYPTDDTRADKPELPEIVPAGPDNPLGTRAIYLGWPTYLIHGTNKPFGVGRRVSRGCIRMYPESVEALFERVPVGAPVNVIDEPIKLGWSNGELFIEVHPDLEQLDELEASYRLTPKPLPQIDARIRSRAGDAQDRIDWTVVRAELKNRRGIPVRITRSPDSPITGLTPHNQPAGFTGIY